MLIWWLKIFPLMMYPLYPHNVSTLELLIGDPNTMYCSPLYIQGYWMTFPVPLLTVLSNYTFPIPQKFCFGAVLDDVNIFRAAVI